MLIHYYLSIGNLAAQLSMYIIHSIQGCKSRGNGGGGGGGGEGFIPPKISIHPPNKYMLSSPHYKYVPKFFGIKGGTKVRTSKF